MNSQGLVTGDSIDTLCALADLPLPVERRARLASMLSGLIAAANDLSSKVANAEYRTIVPITRFPER